MGQSTGTDFSRIRTLLPEIQKMLGEQRLSGWLLYDLHARNNVAVKLLGLGDLSRRYFVFIPATGEPAAITHGIEQGPWEHWPWSRVSYVGWRELGEALQAALNGGGGPIAMEFSDRDAVPSVDLVPAGVIELVRSAGANVVSSGDLITRFYSRWTADDLASHRRASAALVNVAFAAFANLARLIERGESVTEVAMREWVVAELQKRGVGTGADCIFATGRNAANPHYEPVNGGATFKPADVVLLDLWAKETEDSVFADQTWMAYLGAAVPDRAAKVFAIVRDARDAAVEFLVRSWREGRPVLGSEVDDVARAIITDQGYGAFFIHRTGHSIDRATHGMGPNIDNLETREVRRLVPGIGFSIEPGIYIPGELGVRTEINVYRGDRDAVVTGERQTDIVTLL
ncbi:MAG: M24 family metallopeptidase [Longimicrobiales bacterium]